MINWRAWGLHPPDYDGRSLGAVLPAAAVALGADLGADLAHTNLPVAGGGVAIPPARHVVVVLLDGLGQEQLQAYSGHARFLAGSAGAPLSAAFPSTTAVSLPYLGTGRPPGQTGMLGYQVRNPDTGLLANSLSWEHLPEPSKWQPQPHLFAEFAKLGLTVTAVGEPKFADSGLTAAAFNGGKFIGESSFAARVSAVQTAARQPGLSYLYWGELDALGHRAGVGSAAWIAALENTDAMLQTLARSLPRGAVLAITADHGMVNVRSQAFDLATFPPLQRLPYLVGGEPRVAYIYCEASAELKASLQDFIGTAGLVLLRQEAIEANLFGPVLDSVADRIGDLLILMNADNLVIDSKFTAPGLRSLVGMHASLTTAEIKVPWIVVGE